MIWWQEPFPDVKFYENTTVPKVSNDPAIQKRRVFVADGSRERMREKFMGQLDAILSDAEAVWYDKPPNDGFLEAVADTPDEIYYCSFKFYMALKRG